MRLPKTIRIPSADTAHKEGRAAPRAWATAAPRPSRDNKSGDSERNGIQAQRPVRVNHGDDRRACDEPQDLARLEADVADRGTQHEHVTGQHVGQQGGPGRENGAPASTVQNSRVHSAANGMPGMAISPTVPIRSTSQAIMTRRRGNRSARPDSSGPPAIGGR